MLIEGLSCLGAFGSGPEALLAALAGKGAPFGPEVDTASLTRFIPARALRQCDRFSRLALLGACEALESAGVSPTSLAGSPKRYGIVLASGYGTATPTLEFIGSILDFGEAMASPLAFSHSVHNIPAAIIAKSLQITGPCSTVCQREGAVAAGFFLARSLLREGRVDRVLFGAIDEATPTLAAVTAQLVREKGQRPGSGECPTRRDHPVADGAVFFCLSLADGENAGKAMGRITSITMAPPGGMWNMPGSNEASIRFLSGKVPPARRKDFTLEGGVADGGAAYGNLPVSLAFDCAAALSLLGKSENTGKTALCAECGQDRDSFVMLHGAPA